MNAILQVRDLVKRFAGLVATDHVTLDVTEGHIHALIGPNGAGKSTLINQLCGELTPTSGTISLMGEDITKLPAATRVGRGLGRTFQISTLLNDMSVRQNIAMAVQAREGHNFRILDSLKAAAPSGVRLTQSLPGAVWPITRRSLQAICRAVGASSWNC